MKEPCKSSEDKLVKIALIFKKINRNLRMQRFILPFLLGIQLLGYITGINLMIMSFYPALVISLAGCFTIKSMRYRSQIKKILKEDT